MVKASAALLSIAKRHKQGLRGNRGAISLQIRAGASTGLATQIALDDRQAG